MKKTCILESTKYNIMITVIDLANEEVLSLSSNAGVFSVLLYPCVRDPVDVSGVKQEQTSRQTERNQPILELFSTKMPSW